MSVEHMAIALHHSRAVGTAKLVLVGIANHDGDGGAWPSIATLAKYANVEARTVQRAIRQLVEIGELAVITQGGGGLYSDGGTRTNLYRVLVKCPDGCDRSAMHRVTPTSPPPDAHVTPDVDVTPDTSVTPPPDASVTPGVTPTSPKPSLNHPLNQTTSTKSFTTQRGNRLPDDFEPSPALIDWARTEAPHASLRDHEAFVDYWRAQPGAKGRKADWPATWRNWMRKASDDRAAKTAPRASTTDERVRQAQSLKENAAALDARDAAANGTAITTGPRFAIGGTTA